MTDLDLTGDELSALIEACNVAKSAHVTVNRGQVQAPRPPWDRAGSSAHRKLVKEEMRRHEAPERKELDRQQAEELGICTKCDGCGQIADSESQEPWSAWLKLPLESSAAVVRGIVKPIPCPKCNGTGRQG